MPIRSRSRLVSRRDLANEWLVVLDGSLPAARRLPRGCSKRAAREAARRCAGGDDGVLAAFDRDGVRAAWGPPARRPGALVWRHVATARGCSGHSAALADADHRRPRPAPDADRVASRRHRWRRASRSP
ncbi:MAG: hypothetical protein R3B82_10775 [Sandaracinaceae bacterium]